MNPTILQFFHWYNVPEDQLWSQVAGEAERIARLGITHVWLPPAYKSASGIHEPGYAVYDLYDLGEFYQKGTVRTKYGTKAEYLQAIAALHKAGIQVLADVVLNHRMGGDEQELVTTIGVEENDRRIPTGKPEQIPAYSRFTFPGRKGRYSDYVWDHKSFTGFTHEGRIRLLLHEHTGERWEEMLEVEENGNYDYLMGMDVEFRNPYVQEELKKWGIWYMETAGIDGFRLDALKHIQPDFFPAWLDYLQQHLKKDFPVIGEYWKNDVHSLLQYIAHTQGRIRLFDVPLHFRFHEASLQKGHYNMGGILDNTLVKEQPEHAITFVDNHDTQPLQSLESAVAVWFKPLAGTIALLRQEGIPCVSYPGLYGAAYTEEKEGKAVHVKLDKIETLPLMLLIRKNLAYGKQQDYFDHQHIVGWTRAGSADKPHSGLVVLLSNADAGEKRMSMGDQNSGRKMIDISGNRMPDVLLDENGTGLFRVSPENFAIYVHEQAAAQLKP